MLSLIVWRSIWSLYEHAQLDLRLSSSVVSWVLLSFYLQDCKKHLNETVVPGACRCSFPRTIESESEEGPMISLLYGTCWSLPGVASVPAAMLATLPLCSSIFLTRPFGWGVALQLFQRNCLVPMSAVQAARLCPWQNDLVWLHCRSHYLNVILYQLEN